VEKQVGTSRGEVIRIGKFKVTRTPNFDFAIPELPLLVVRKPDGGYVSKGN
jgi:hypothetical protein